MQVEVVMCVGGGGDVCRWACVQVEVVVCVGGDVCRWRW